MELSSVLTKVRALVNLAEHPDTPINEAKSAREMADSLMLKFAIDSADLDKSRPAIQRSKPGKIEVDVCPVGSVFEQYLRQLAEAVASYTRCQVVYKRAGVKPTKEYKAAYSRMGLKVQAIVFGYESDLAYFELLFTTLHLHLASGLEPKWDESKTDAQNAYIMHNAGLTWAEMEKTYGHKGPHHYRNAYWAECKRLGEPRVTMRSRIVYQGNFAQAYVTRVWQRLEAAKNARGPGAEVALVDRSRDVADLLAETYPQLKTIRSRSVKYDANAYGRGDAHGRAADLNTGSRVGVNKAKGIES